MPFPALIAIMAAVARLSSRLTRRTIGRQVVAVGSNMEAARRVGMPGGGGSSPRSIVADRARLGDSPGMMIAARLGSGSSNAAVGFELQVIAAVVLGGTR